MTAPNTHTPSPATAHGGMRLRDELAHAKAINRELLDALRQVLDSAERVIDQDQDWVFAERARYARAAIAKAEGR